MAVTDWPAVGISMKLDQLSAHLQKSGLGSERHPSLWAVMDYGGSGITVMFTLHKRGPQTSTAETRKVFQVSIHLKADLFIFFPAFVRYHKILSFFYKLPHFLSVINNNDLFNAPFSENSLGWHEVKQIIYT